MRTCESYTERVDLLCRWADGRRLLDLTTDDLEQFLDGRRLSASSRAAFVTAIANFYAWLVDVDLLSTSPADKVARPRVRPGRPRPLADDTLSLALASATPESRAMLLLGALAGLRVSEIAQLRGEDVDFDLGLLEVVDGKGGKSRVIPLHPTLADALRALPIPASGPVFLSQWGAPLKGHNVSERIADVLAPHGGGSAHQLRHWAGTRWYQVSRDLLATAELMGHANPKTTMGYARFDLDKAGVRAVRAVELPGS